MSTTFDAQRYKVPTREQWRQTPTPATGGARSSVLAQGQRRAWRRCRFDATAGSSYVHLALLESRPMARYGYRPKTGQ